MAINEPSETDKLIVDRAQGCAERAVLGKNPYGSMLRIGAFIVLFLLSAGAMFIALAK